MFEKLDSWNDMDDVSRNSIMGFMEGEEKQNLPRQEIHEGGIMELAIPQHTAGNGLK